MTRFIYDQFAKQYLKELLTPFGTVETSRDIGSEVRQVDVQFSPRSPNPTELSELGLLGKLATTAAIFEPFRNAVQPKEVRSCLSKLHDLQAELERQANRENTRISESELPRLWILSPTASPQLLDGFRAVTAPGWTSGIYFLAPLLNSAIVVIHQLPNTPETLWLRILGKGTVQKQAIASLRELPEDNPYRLAALELLYNLKTILDARQDLDREDRELIMELSPMYLQRLEIANQQGIQQGIQQGQRLMVETMLQVKFGTIDLELSQIIEPLIQLSALEITQLIMQLNREELLARFNPQG
jgi:hypothetical protein